MLPQHLEIMKDVQENKYSMYLAVKKVLADNTGVWSWLQAFVTAVGTYMIKLDRIGDLVEVQTTPTTGVRKDKMQALDLMVHRTVALAGAVFAYATEVNNQTLRDVMAVSESDLRQVRDTLAVERARSVHEHAAPLAGSLSDYGVTAVEIADVDSAITAFANSIPQPRVAISTRKGATTELAIVMKQVDGVLKDTLDKLMPKFKTTAPEFYANYFNARIIVDSGGARGRAELQLTVVMEGTLAPVSDARVAVTPKGKHGVTDASGKLALKGLRQGNATVTVMKPGLMPQAVEVTLVNDEAVELTVVMA
jgi:uncharacterized membrane protein